ncbi:MAG: XisI protein [Cyanobacteria bacterium J06628_6]
MERVDYPPLVRSILRKHATNDIPSKTEVQLVCDTESHHYQVLHLGWQDLHRVYGCIVHVDIKDDGKIWIQRDGTETGIANELTAAGVPKTDIVLAFHAPYKRKLTGFAVE